VKLAGFSAGVSYTQNGGFGANVGYEFGGNNVLSGLGLNLNYSQSGGFGGGISYSKKTEGGTTVTGGLNYSKDAGVGASLNAQKKMDASDAYTATVTGGVSFSQKQGFGASLDASIEKVAEKTPPGQTPPPKPQFQSFSQMDMGLSFNQKEGFSASVGFDGVNALSYNQNTGLSGNTNFGVDLRKKYIQDEIDDEVKENKKVAAEKEAEYLAAIAKENGWEGLPPEEIAKRQKKKILDDPNAEKGGSRHGILENVIGDIVDDVKTSLGYVSSDLVEQVDGKFRVRTCFVAGTKVHTKDGLKNIEDIQVGDVVLSKSDETGEVSYRKVVNTFIRQTDAIYSVSFADGTILETTWNHPFRVKKQGHALEKFSIETTDWVQAKDLHPGDVALGADGRELVVTDITIDERVETVYNFEVDEYHTYFVGEVGVWVHNNDNTYTEDSVDAFYGKSQEENDLAKQLKDSKLKLETMQKNGEITEQQKKLAILNLETVQASADGDTEKLLEIDKKIKEITSDTVDKFQNLIDLDLYSESEKLQIRQLIYQGVVYDSLSYKLGGTGYKEGIDCTHYGQLLSNNTGKPHKFVQTKDFESSTEIKENFSLVTKGTFKEVYDSKNKTLLKPGDRIITYGKNTGGNPSGHDVTFLGFNKKGKPIVTQSTGGGVRPAGVDGSFSAYKDSDGVDTWVYRYKAKK
ncbi:polymorphic toxin-type HINT domain-containing protein, partial [Leptospira harrisiae]|uniref:polymorphic toxin-type HINT domain-containing protein n=1 Tax=Leptospira harrisiae TaxID=2023189 RepID=UPI001AD7EFD8